MEEEKLLDHVISRLEPQLLDYVEREFNRIEGQGVADNRIFDGQRRGDQSDHRFHNQGGRQGDSRKDQTGFYSCLIAWNRYGGPRTVVSRPYHYHRVKQAIIDYHIEKMLQEGTIRSILCPYATPVFLTRKNNGPPYSPEAYRFANDYRKLNAITKYPRYPLPVMDDLITNIPHTGIMPTLDLKSGYFFQFAISPKDVKKTAFITRNGTFAFLRMPFGLSEAAPNFQNAIDIILKPVIRRFVMVYMYDVIITSPLFNEHIDNLNQGFTLLREVGLTLNKDINVTSHMTN
ncbi:retrovirus-related Pol polyprotein from transposon 17.6 [Trichonephila clavipes]|nr:retrovirus-related Pol polyprotein from transposon 17.6 [Trichonephila clavipes]